MAGSLFSQKMAHSNLSKINEMKNDFSEWESTSRTRIVRPKLTGVKIDRSKWENGPERKKILWFWKDCDNMNWSDFSIEELMLFAITAPFFVGLFLATFGFLVGGIKLILFPGEDGFWGSLIKIQEQMNEFNELARKNRWDNDSQLLHPRGWLDGCNL